ncbi:hypothetical protein NQ317_015004 [Molorchus minor]|uniref:Uncharacterized protein n=1 Tax=Molorchus minor TaxID=1323400 RepID=A0ABQ9K4E5_9CUCU|nr:hypothetical protein NQ317_015004 [Molorchus minor]
MATCRGGFSIGSFGQYLPRQFTICRNYKLKESANATTSKTSKDKMDRIFAIHVFVVIRTISSCLQIRQYARNGKERGLILAWCHILTYRNKDGCRDVGTNKDYTYLYALPMRRKLCLYKLPSRRCGKGIFNVPDIAEFTEPPNFHCHHEPAKFSEELKKCRLVMLASNRVELINWYACLFKTSSVLFSKV